LEFVTAATGGRSGGLTAFTGFYSNNIAAAAYTTPNVRTFTDDIYTTEGWDKASGEFTVPAALDGKHMVFATAVRDNGSAPIGVDLRKDGAIIVRGVETGRNSTLVSPPLLLATGEVFSTTIDKTTTLSSLNSFFSGHVVDAPVGGAGATETLLFADDLAATPVAEIEIGGIDLYDEIIILQDGVGNNQSNTILTLSSDDGATYETSYSRWWNQTSATNVTAQQYNAAIANLFIGSGQITHARHVLTSMKSTNMPTHMLGNQLHSSKWQREEGHSDTLLVHNKLKIEPDVAGLLNAGTIRIIGIKYGSGGVSDFAALTDTPADYTGHAGKVAAVNSGETGLEFVDAPTGGGGGGSTFVDTGMSFIDKTQTTSAFAAKGAIGTCTQAVTILAAFGGFDIQALTDRYKFELWSCVGATNVLDTKVAESDVWVPDAVGRQQNIFDFTGTYTTVPGTRYWAAWVKTDGVGTDPCRCFTGSTYDWQPLGFEGLDDQFRLTSTAPASTDTLDVLGTTFVVSCGFIYEYVPSSAVAVAAGETLLLEQNFSITPATEVLIDNIDQYDEIYLHSDLVVAGSSMFLRLSEDHNATFVDGADTYTRGYMTPSIDAAPLATNVEFSSSGSNAFTSIRFMSSSEMNTQFHGTLGNTAGANIKLEYASINNKNVQNGLRIYPASGMMTGGVLRVVGIKYGGCLGATDSGHAATDALPDDLKRLGVDGKKYAEPSLVHGYFIANDVAAIEVKTGQKSWSKSAKVLNPTLLTDLPFGGGTTVAAGSKVCRTFASEISDGGGEYTGDTSGTVACKIETTSLTAYYLLTGTHWTTVEWLEP
jgi:hypothetical protein